MENEARIKSVLSNVLGVSPDDISEDSSMDTLEKWDSLKHLNVVLALEEEFKIFFEDEESVIITSYPLIREILKEHGVKFGTAGTRSS